jgi:hypothetical protein
LSRDHSGPGSYTSNQNGIIIDSSFNQNFLPESRKSTDSNLSSNSRPTNKPLISSSYSSQNHSILNKSNGSISNFGSNTQNSSNINSSLPSNNCIAQSPHPPSSMVQGTNFAYGHGQNDHHMTNQNNARCESLSDPNNLAEDSISIKKSESCPMLDSPNKDNHSREQLNDMNDVQNYVKSGFTCTNATTQNNNNNNNIDRNNQKSMNSNTSHITTIHNKHLLGTTGMETTSVLSTSTV